MSSTSADAARSLAAAYRRRAASASASLYSLSLAAAPSTGCSELEPLCHRGRLRYTSAQESVDYTVPA
jgi:hypothetical protein